MFSKKSNEGIDEREGVAKDKPPRKMSKEWSKNIFNKKETHEKASTCKEEEKRSKEKRERSSLRFHRDSIAYVG
jgi:hypothetical protein